MDEVTTPPVQRPLFVDLDGTLIATDALWESALLLVKQRPFDTLLLPLWLRNGKAHLKCQIAERVVPNAASLPYRPEVLEFLREQKAGGRKIILATASHERIAVSVAQHLGLFDGVMATSSKRNLAGDRKLEAIREHAGESGFDYMGDSAADICLWKDAGGAYIVHPKRGVLAKANAVCKPARVFEASPFAMPRAMVRALRPNQWVKNILILLPLLLAHQIGDHRRLMQTLLAMICFSLVASCVYLCNDLLDLEADRQHPRKVLRPFASGALPIPDGLAMLGGLLVTSFTIAAVALPYRFVLALAAYLVLSSAYTFYFKRKLLLDVMVLAGLYTMRLIAGGYAAEVPVTVWLKAFSMFIFVSLAFAKRYSELTMLKKANKVSAAGRSYMTDDLDIILSVGPASGYLSVLVLCLYIEQSKEAMGFYAHRSYLFLICPVLMYWITRIWFFARRHALVDDPIVFALKDRVSYIAGLISALLVLFAQ